MRTIGGLYSREEFVLHRRLVKRQTAEKIASDSKNSGLTEEAVRRIEQKALRKLTKRWHLTPREARKRFRARYKRGETRRS